MDPGLESRPPPARQTAIQTLEPNLHRQSQTAQMSPKQQEQQQQQQQQHQQQNQQQKQNPPQPSSSSSPSSSSPPPPQQQQQPQPQQPASRRFSRQQQPPQKPQQPSKPLQNPPPQQQTPPSPPRSAAVSGRSNEDGDANHRGNSVIDGQTRSRSASAMSRSGSLRSFAAGDDRFLPVRNNTLRKRTSMRRSNSRRSNRAGSVRSLAVQTAPGSDDVSNAFFCPVPTSGTPTDVLANRFQVWRKILKDVIAYFREIQSHYEQRAKSLFKLVNLGNNIATPPNFLSTGGIDDALQLLRKHNTAALQEASKAKEIEDDVILALTGLRSDLQQKIKEIRHLAGDFKNSVDREIEGTQKAVRALADALEKTEIDSSFATGKQDPYLLRLAVDQQVERQIDEENYLHQAYLNLEGSGRELESIVVGEIQKAYNAYAGILKREAENAYNAVEELRQGPINMPKDQEWNHFVKHDDQIIDPTIPMRSADQIHYPGQDHVAASEIRAGLLERKSKYLKSYTAGWYVLSATHLHEFKSADKAQAPVMSLYLPEQKLGSHSAEGGASNKFVLKGRQTGAMHRGHTWVFRAESHDTMMAWYDDIQVLTEKTAEERCQFVRSHSRSLSRSSRRSASSDGMGDDDDEEPFSANRMDVAPEPAPRRPEPGGRFPSDIQTNAQRGSQAPSSPSSVNTGRQEDMLLDAHAIAASGAAYAASSGSDEQRGQQQDGGGGRGGGAFEGEEEEDGKRVKMTRAKNGELTATGGEKSIPDASAQTTRERSVSDADRARYMDERKMIDAEVEARGVGGAYAIDGGDSEQHDREEAAVDSIPRSEARNSLLPEARLVAHAMARGETASAASASSQQRPAAEGRADSSATLSNLPMPGNFPRGGGGVVSA
ncbi:hypothetical protein CP532_0943 [Ophiocordyceps camponoti-leonardi (nom. inval.)]|nr:hypothetical protein CP532_0943 [Ophiocordyceps camponoti-leonardi (nom. inval.)]